MIITALLKYDIITINNLLQTFNKIVPIGEVSLLERCPCSVITVPALHMPQLYCLV